MNTYSTRDFYLVAYLHMLGNPIADTRLVNPNTTELRSRRMINFRRE